MVVTQRGAHQPTLIHTPLTVIAEPLLVASCAVTRVSGAVTYIFVIKG